MDLSFTPEQEAFRAEVRAFINSAIPPNLADKAKNHEYYSQAEQRRVAQDPGQEGLGGAALAQGVRRRRASTPTRRFILTEELELAGAPDLAVRPAHGRPADLPVRQRRAEASASCRRSSAARRCGARATPSRTPAAIWRRCADAPRTTAKATSSSTARRPGPPTRSTPTGSSASCAPIAALKKARWASASSSCDMKTPGVARGAVPHHRRHARVLRDLLRQREGAEGEPGRPAERRLDPGQGAARPRAHAHRRCRRLDARCC